MQAVTLRHLSKQFTLGHAEEKSILFHLMGLFSGRVGVKSIWALKDITFSIEPGEVIGILGPNGAGKSTLLSTIAGIYKRYDGDLRVNGRVVSVIGLVSGLKDRLSLIDNIYITMGLYGHSQAFARKKEKDIVTFAGLLGYENTKLFQFSTGMIARLIFSIAVHTKPAVLLLDEVTSNLDKEFTNIVTKTIQKLTQEGVAVIVVSHKKEVIRQCDRVMHIEKGEIQKFGTSKKIIASYF